MLVAIWVEHDGFVAAAITATILAVFAALAAGFVASRQIVDPILDVREAIRNPQGNGKMPVNRPDEIGGLARTIARGREHHEKVISDQVAALSHRETQLRATFDNMEQGVAMYDADYKLVTWNRQFRELLDLPDSFFDEGHTFID